MIIAYDLTKDNFYIPFGYYVTRRVSDDRFMTIDTDDDFGSVEEALIVARTKFPEENEVFITNNFMVCMMIGTSTMSPSRWDFEGWLKKGEIRRYEA